MEILEILMLTVLGSYVLFLAYWTGHQGGKTVVEAKIRAALKDTQDGEDG